jgi:hypothetical protein
MSARRIRRERERRETKRATKLAVTAARKQGCCCAVEVHVQWLWSDFPMVAIAHDNWCPLYRARQEGAGRDDAMDVWLAPREVPFRGPRGKWDDGDC